MHTPTTHTVHTLSLRNYADAHGSHAHDHFQVLIGLDGVLEIEVEGRGAGIGVGEAQVVAPGDRHDFQARDNSSVCLVLDTTHAPWARCPERAPPDALQLHTLARYLAQCMAQPEQSALALQCGPALLLEAWGPSPAHAPSDARRRRIDWPLLAEWARARWHAPLGVADLADVACLSPSQFAQRCRDEQGMSAMHWLRTLRLSHARELRLGGMGVAETARRTGYRSPSALTAALRRFGA